MIGFTSYDIVKAPSVPTTAELVSALTAGQRIAILNGFANKILPQRLKKQIFIKPEVIRHMYNRIDAIEEFSRTITRGELVDKPAEYFVETGEVKNPETYIKAPTTVTELKTAVDKEFGDEFSNAQSGAIVDKMIKMSKKDGSGTAAFWLSNVVK